jgi:hypothetical protein
MIEIKSRDQIINEIMQSNSWKLTKLFRKIGQLIRNH